MTAHPTDSGSAISLSVILPPGYHELPMSTIRDSVAKADRIAAFMPAEVAGLVPEVAPAIADLVSVLRANNACYCAIGQHAAPDGTPLTSWLTVSMLDRGRVQNPRLTIAELAGEKASDGRGARVEVVDLGGRSVLFAESTTSYAVLDGPDEIEAPGRNVYQIEAVVVSDDGAHLAVAVLSTVDVPHGPDFGAMMVMLAGSITFGIVVDPRFTLAL